MSLNFFPPSNPRYFSHAAFSQPPDSIYAGINAHLVRRPFTFTVRQQPFPEALPSAGSSAHRRIPFSSIGNLGSWSTSASVVVTVAMSSSSRRCPHRHLAATTLVSSATRRSTACSVDAPPRKHLQSLARQAGTEPSLALVRSYVQLQGVLRPSSSVC
nr:uncharacterized protein LOC123494511 [Aegilops tauschii subsp. strangulata]